MQATLRTGSSPVFYYTPLDFRNVASTMSAARTLGDRLPVDMMSPIPANAST